MTMWPIRCAVLAAVALGVGQAAVADGSPNLEPLIQQVLDEQIRLSVDQHRPLPEVLERITEVTGVKLDVDPAVYELLPYGRETRVRLRLGNVTLREGLAGFLRPLGLTFRVAGDAVIIEPRPALRRLCRRSTLTELQTLDRLARLAGPPVLPWTDRQRPAEQPALVFRVSDPDYRDKFEDALKRVAEAGSLEAILENACDVLGWTWFCEGDRVIIVDRQTQLRRQLERRISLYYLHANLDDVLLELGRLAGLPVDLEPGLLRRIPPGLREDFSITAQNISVRQALELISGTTGLAYDVDLEGIHLRAGPLLNRESAVYVRSQDPYVAKISVPSKSSGFSLEFLVRESELPPEINAWRRRVLKEAVEALAKELPR